MTLPTDNRYGRDLMGYTPESFQYIDEYIRKNYDKRGKLGLNHENVFIRTVGPSMDESDDRDHEQLLIPKNLLGRDGVYGDLELTVPACVRRKSKDRRPWPASWKPVNLRRVFTGLGADPRRPPPAYEHYEPPQRRPRPASRPPRPRYRQGDGGRSGRENDYGAGYYERYYEKHYGHY